MKRSWLTVLFVVLLSLTLAACGGSKASPEPSKAAAQPAAGTAQLAANPAPTAKPVGQAEEEEPTAEVIVEPITTGAPDDDSLSLASRDTGLDQLKSYKMRWQANWKSTESGKTDSTSWDWSEEYSSDPPASHWIWKIVGQEGNGSQGAWETWQIGDVSYMRMTGDDGKQTCISSSSDDKSNQPSRGIFSPSMLGSLNNAKFAGNDTVNGIRTKHYTYDDASASLVGFGKVNGETWIAIDGGYVVKDVMKWEGGGGLFGAGSDSTGSGQWTWELSNVDQPVSIEPPADCASKADGLPLLNIATEKSTIGDTIMYKSPVKMAEAASFYQEAMPAAGWQAEGDPQVSDAFTVLSFTKDKQTAQVMLTQDEGSVQVMINVTTGE